MVIRKLFLKKSKALVTYIEKDIFNKINNEFILQHLKKQRVLIGYNYNLYILLVVLFFKINLLY